MLQSYKSPNADVTLLILDPMPITRAGGGGKVNITSLNVTCNEIWNSQCLVSGIRAQRRFKTRC